MKDVIIDLSQKKFSGTDSMPLAKLYLGGRGMNMFYLCKFLEPGTDPLTPGNPLIFGTGMLTGTPAPNSGRMNVTAKSPETGILGDSNVGGHFGPAMRDAGFDRLVMLGRAEKLSYIYLENGRVEVRDAEEYRGMNNYELRDVMKDELGNVEIACIGEAGENMVRFASIMFGLKNAAGRTGMGAVMGSKNLKAIVVGDGTKTRHSSGFKEYSKKLHERIAASGAAKALHKYGTSFLYETSNKMNAMRTKNSQLTTFEDSLNAENFQPYSEKMIGCYNCAVKCRHVNSLGGEGPEYTTIGLLGANNLIAKPEDVIKLNNLCNDLGLDTSSSGSIIAWATELYERGLIDSDVELEFGNPELVELLLKRISRREGLGNILAESSQAVKYFGEESKKYLLSIKGLPQSDPHDCRIVKSFFLGIAVASRGADHLRNRPTLDMFPDELKKKIYGEHIDTDVRSYKTKEEMVKLHEDVYAVVDSLGICKFVCRYFNSPSLVGYEDFSKMIEFATGLQITEEELAGIGGNIVDLERRINMGEGITGVHDSLPERYAEPNEIGDYIDKEEFHQMLQRYYKLRRWDSNGNPL